MAVNVAVEPAFGVVQMHTAQIVETDDVAELLKGLFTVLFGTQIVTGGKSVASVDANTNPPLAFSAIDDRRQMFEFEPQIAALVGSVFDHRRYALDFIQHDVN